MERGLIRLMIGGTGGENAPPGGHGYNPPQRKHIVLPVCPEKASSRHLIEPARPKGPVKPSGAIIGAELQREKKKKEAEQKHGYKQKR